VLRRSRQKGVSAGMFWGNALLSTWKGCSSGATFSVHSTTFSGLTKKEFSVHQLFFWFKSFSHRSDPAGLTKKELAQKKVFGSEKGSPVQKQAFWLQNVAFSLILRLLGFKTLSPFKVFSGSNTFFVHIRPDSPKRI
jgi:hypothetical protein